LENIIPPADSQSLPPADPSQDTGAREGALKAQVDYLAKLLLAKNTEQRQQEESQQQQQQKQQQKQQAQARQSRRNRFQQKSSVPTRMNDARGFSRILMNTNSNAGSSSTYAPPPMNVPQHLQQPQSHSQFSTPQRHARDVAAPSSARSDASGFTATSAHSYTHSEGGFFNNGNRQGGR
jgi:hypothetical protein